MPEPTPIRHSQKHSDGTYLLLSSCKDGNPMLRDWLGDWVGTFLGHKGAVWCARLSGGDAARAVSGSADFSAKVWDTYTGECVQTISHGHIVRSVAIDRAGSKIITGGNERILRLFDLAASPSTETASVFKRDGETSHETPIRSIVQSWDDENIIATAEDRAVHWWDARSLECVHTMSFDEPIVSMDRTCGSFGEYLAIASGHDALFVDLKSRNVVRKHTLEINPSSVSLHPVNGERFVAGCVDDEWVRVYDTQGEQLDLHKGHHGPVHCVSYTPDGEVAASGSEDGTIRLWQNIPGTKYGLWA
ncbi:hypothetical protein MCUN1_002946 [Malassezia cuniculi]|uniref:Serine-threonine kinase receptor-associated protein n=1 Tax=Malassezia cuniculi TaxID=948313 RepID=A0AAF0J7G4_9BASI|nr:hypothetical protein MCUN1_002946 [Malassezia cuniculi]